MTGKRSYVVYILRTEKNTLYVGQTPDLENRLMLHRKGKGSKYLRPFKALTVVYQEVVPTLSAALKREYELKQLTHAQKEALIAAYRPTASMQDELQRIPGVGKSIAADLRGLGITRIADLQDTSPEVLYEQLCEKVGTRVDRCMLYVFRCAVYFASHAFHDPKKLQWWYWKDKR